MNSRGFLRIANEAFAPFLSQLGFEMEKPTLSGRYYQASFIGCGHSVIVTYEPGDEALFVIVPSCRNGQFSNIDDRGKTPRLADLNDRYMPTITKEERAENARLFEHIVANDKEERQLLKAALELCLVLPKYLLSQ